MIPSSLVKQGFIDSTLAKYYLLVHDQQDTKAEYSL